MYYGDRDRDFDPSKTELSYNMFKMGLYTENDKQSSWTQSYRGIRNATTFIHNVYMNTEMTPDEIEDYRGQARFGRAYLYWLLLRKYGPIPLLPDEGIDYTKVMMTLLQRVVPTRNVPHLLQMSYYSLLKKWKN
ncbi:RagB/SusD family nutrient uptake outer membrane protein [Sphingobacterium sp. KU25419]|nr:RagB/SusD family nutrient uptake outer membrane protein [Sphingobacterium sp. KU25419]